MARVFAGLARRDGSAWALALDAVIAVAATVLAISEVISHARGTGLSGFRLLPSGGVVPIPANPYPSLWQLAAVVLMAVPLAVRRVYPVAACAVIFAAACAFPHQAPPMVFATAIFAVFSAVLYSAHRELALGVALAGAIAVMATFPENLPDIPERYTALIVVVPTVAAGLGIRELRRRVGDSTARLRKVQAEHEAATRRARRPASPTSHTGNATAVLVPKRWASRACLYGFAANIRVPRHVLCERGLPVVGLLLGVCGHERGD